VALGGLVARTARDQAAHGVAHESDVFDVDRPRGDQLLEQRVERGAVLGDVAASVVPDVDGRAAQVARQARSVALTPSEPPGELGLHQPVEEHHDPPARPRERLVQVDDGPARDPHGHALVERAALQLVAHEAVDDGERQRAARAGRHDLAADDHTRGPAGQAERPAHAGVYRRADRVVRRAGDDPERSDGRERPVGHRPVHAAGGLADPGHLGEGEPDKLGNLVLLGWAIRGLDRPHQYIVAAGADVPSRAVSLLVSASKEHSLRWMHERESPRKGR
jgi:hypothetical protein